MLYTSWQVLHDPLLERFCPLPYTCPLLGHEAGPRDARPLDRMLRLCTASAPLG